MKKNLLVGKFQEKNILHTFLIYQVIRQNYFAFAGMQRKNFQLIRKVLAHKRKQTIVKKDLTMNYQQKKKKKKKYN